MRKKLNIENMERAVDFLKENYDRIAPNFNMITYRSRGDEYNPICSTTGCLAGWLSGLDVENVKKNYTRGNGTVNWSLWSTDVFGLRGYKLGTWSFLFGQDWCCYDVTNTLDQGIARLEYMIKHKAVPEGWHYGDTYLDGDCYTYRL